MTFLGWAAVWLIAHCAVGVALAEVWRRYDRNDPEATNGEKVAPYDWPVYVLVALLWPVPATIMLADWLGLLGDVSD